MKATHGGRKPPTTPPKFGGIDPSMLYRRDELLARLGWGSAAYRTAIRQGLRTFESGRRTFILGSDLVAYVKATSTAEEGHA